MIEIVLAKDINGLEPRLIRQGLQRCSSAFEGLLNLPAGSPAAATVVRRSDKTMVSVAIGEPLALGSMGGTGASFLPVSSLRQRSLGAGCLCGESSPRSPSCTSCPLAP
jgi:hypothetical protein